MTATGLHLTQALGAALADLGWDAEDARIRDAAPTAARGHNLVVICPPAPLYLAPTLAGVLSRPVTATGPRTLLLLTPGHLRAEWRELLAALQPAGWTPAFERPGAARAIAAGVPALLVLEPEAALELRRRSELAAEGLLAVVVAWPERFHDVEVLPAILEGAAKELQRIVVTSDPARSAPVVERHAWRALTVGTAVEPVPREGLRTVEVPWGRRVGLLPDLARFLGVSRLAVWTGDRSRHGEIHRALYGSPGAVEITDRHPESADVVVAFDPPDAATLARLCETGDTVLLAPPGTESYFAALAPMHRPLLLPEELADTADEAGERRSRIARAARESDLGPDLAVLAPLLEAWGPSRVAAAAYRLWGEERRARGRPQQAAAPAAPTTRLWIGVGRKDDAGPNDLVGLLANELRVDRGAIGRIDVRETYSLVEVPSERAEALARAITGRSVRRRRLVARVDRKER